MIARTKHIDAEFMDALENGFEHIVIFGVGFDARPQRFNHLNKSTWIFKLDVPITQDENAFSFSGGIERHQEACRLIGDAF